MTQKLLNVDGSKNNLITLFSSLLIHDVTRNGKF